MVFCRKCGGENKPGNKYCIKCGSALAPAKRGADIKTKSISINPHFRQSAYIGYIIQCLNIGGNRSPPKYYFIGSLITSLIGGIMLLFGEFGSWTIRNSWWDSYREQYESEYYYYSIGALYPESPLSSFILLCLVALLLYGAYVSYLGLRFSETLNEKKLKQAFYGATTVFLVCIIGGIIFESNMNDVYYSNLQEGFFGGFIFGGLTAGLLGISYHKKRKG